MITCNRHHACIKEDWISKVKTWSSIYAKLFPMAEEDMMCKLNVHTYNVKSTHCPSHNHAPPPPNTITIVVHNHTVTAFIAQWNLNLFCMNNLPSSFARWHQCLVCQTACLKPCEHFMNAPRVHVLTAAIYGRILNTTALWYASCTSSLSVTILVCLAFFLHRTYTEINHMT